MGFSEEISALKSKAESQLHALSTREKTKNALFLPFVQALGYDPFDIREVEPGFAVEVGGNGHKTVDYAIKRNGTPIMFFECKEAGTDLAAYDPDPLFRYFSEIEARIGVLTNGIDYRFYADVGEEISGDHRPFMEFNLLDCGPEEVGELERMRKSSLDIEDILSTARDLKHKRLFKDYLDLQWKRPDEKFVRFMAERIYDGQVPEGVHERFGPVVREALREFTRERSRARLESTRREERPRPTTQSKMSKSSETKSDPEPTRQAEKPEPTRQSEEATSTGQTGETSNEEALNGEPEEGSDPFEKNLAERVIDGF